MTVAFGVTKISGPHIIGPGLKVAVFKMQQPEVSVEAGHTMDVSAYFTTVLACICGPSGATGDFGDIPGLVGTYAAVGTDAAACKMTFHRGPEAAGAFPVTTAGTNLSTADDMYVTAFGR